MTPAPLHPEHREPTTDKERQALARTVMDPEHPGNPRRDAALAQLSSEELTQVLAVAAASKREPWEPSPGRLGDLSALLGDELAKYETGR